MPTYVLSVPPGVNNLYVNAGHSRRKSPRYKAWIKGEMMALVAQRARPVTGPVSLSFSFPNSIRGDLDGRMKAAIDLIVRAGIIPDDNKKIVRQISAGFAAVEQMHVCILPLTDSEE